VDIGATSGAGREVWNGRRGGVDNIGVVGVNDEDLWGFEDVTFVLLVLKLGSGTPGGGEGRGGGYDGFDFVGFGRMAFILIVLRVKVIGCWVGVSSGG
jgi:hypothetical protein